MISELMISRIAEAELIGDKKLPLIHYSVDFKGAITGNGENNFIDYNSMNHLAKNSSELYGNTRHGSFAARIISLGNPSLIKWLLESTSTTPNTVITSSGKNAFHVASYEADPCVFDLLFNYSTVVDDTDYLLYTPMATLMINSFNENIDALETIMDKLMSLGAKANPRIKSSHFNSQISLKSEMILENNSGSRCKLMERRLMLMKSKLMTAC
jgi:hypothetical protein